MTRRVVFLDFDGVVMTAGSYERAGKAVRPVGAMREEAAYVRLDPALVANVSTLCERIGADIVLSTSWRGSTEEDRVALEAALWARGLAGAIPVVGQTPHASLTGERGGEILAWLDEHRPGWAREDVVVLDDDSDMEPFLDRWVRSSWVDGFGADQLAEALALFGSPPSTRPASTTLLTFTVEGPPRGAMRHRSAVRGKRAAMYHDLKHTASEGRFTLAAGAAWGRRAPLDVPVTLLVESWHRRPERLCRKRHRGTGALPYAGKPDADNIAKLVMDGLTKAGVWTDDTRVADLVVRRRYLPLDEMGAMVERERVVVTVQGTGGGDAE